MSDFEYDVLVIGAGPGGYVAAIRAAQLGLKTACVESRATLGGTCLNVGCIPSKALLHGSELFEEAAGGHFATWGITAEPKLDLGKMMAEKTKAVGELTGGIEFLFKKNKVTWLKGHAAFADAHTVKVGDETVTARDIVIATGSSVAPLPGVTVDNAGKRIVDSTGALDLDEVPEHLVVIGGGVIGLELGSVWRRLGAKVTVVEYLDQLLPGMDGEVRKEAGKIFKKQGMTLMLGHKVTGAKVDGKTVSLTVEKSAGRAMCSWRSAGVPTPMASRSTRRASRSTTAAKSKSTTISAPRSTASGRSAMSSPARCSRTRPRTKASRSPRTSPGRPAS